jgi:hypothetical protein
MGGEPDGQPDGWQPVRQRPIVLGHGQLDGDDHLPVRGLRVKQRRDHAAGQCPVHVRGQRRSLIHVAPLRLLPLAA